jgi:hypothetical protein
MTAGSLPVKWNVVSILFRPSPRRRRIFMHWNWLADYLVRPRLAASIGRLPASARATEWSTTGQRIVSRRACAGLTDQSARQPRGPRSLAGTHGKPAGDRVGRIMTRMSRPSCGCLPRRSRGAFIGAEPVHRLGKRASG